jgi:hypothetical protein
LPRGNKMGPMGFGPRSGRGAGFCAGYPAPGYLNPGPRRGRAFWHRGWGWCHHPVPGHSMPYYPGYCVSQPNPDDERAILEDQAKMLQAEIDALKTDLKEIERRAQELRRQDDNREA